MCYNKESLIKPIEKIIFQTGMGIVVKNKIKKYCFYLFLVRFYGNLEN